MPFSDVLKHLAKSNIGYTIVDKAQVERVANTEHHEGVAFVVKNKELLSVDEAIQKGTVSSVDTKDLTQPCLLVSLRLFSSKIYFAISIVMLFYFLRIISQYFD